MTTVNGNPSYHIVVDPGGGAGSGIFSVKVAGVTKLAVLHSGDAVFHERITTTTGSTLEFETTGTPSPAFRFVSGTNPLEIEDVGSSKVMQTANSLHLKGFDAEVEVDAGATDVLRLSRGTDQLLTFSYDTGQIRTELRQVKPASGFRIANEDGKIWVEGTLGADLLASSGDVLVSAPGGNVSVVSQGTARIDANGRAVVRSLDDGVDIQGDGGDVEVRALQDFTVRFGQDGTATRAVRFIRKTDVVSPRDEPVVEIHERYETQFYGGEDASGTHYIVAALNCQDAVGTEFDNHLELAIENSIRGHLTLNRADTGGTTDRAAVITMFSTAGAERWIWVDDAGYVRSDATDPGTTDKPTTSRYVAHAPFPVFPLTGTSQPIPADGPQGFVMNVGATGLSSYDLPAVGPWITAAAASACISVLVYEEEDVEVTVDDPATERIYWGGNSPTSGTTLSLTGTAVDKGAFVTLLALPPDGWAVIASAGPWSLT